MLKGVIRGDGDAGRRFHPSLKQTFKSHQSPNEINKADETFTAPQDRCMGPEREAALLSPQENTDFNSVRHLNCIH